MPIQIKLIEPYEHQKNLLAQCGRKNLLLLGRRYGKTTIMSAILKERAITRSGYRGAYSAPTWKLMIEAFEEAKETLQPVTHRVNREDRRIEVYNGTPIKSVLEFWSSDDPQAGRGRRYHDWVSDETQRQKHLKKFLIGSVSPTLADFRGNLYVLGTTNGVGSELHEFWTECTADPDWFVGVGTTDDNPYIDEEEKRTLRKNLGVLAGQEMDSLWLQIDGIAPLVSALAWQGMYAVKEAGHRLKTLAIDASVSGDKTAIVGVWSEDEHFYVDYDDIIILYPDPITGKINYPQLIDILERRWRTGRYANFVYDPYQMESVIQGLQAQGVSCIEHTQNTARLKSDSYLKQLVNQGRFHHPGHDIFTEHFTNATLKFNAGDTVRIVKPSRGASVDLAVASAMAARIHHETVPAYAQSYLPQLSAATSLLYPKSSPVAVKPSPWSDRTYIRDLVKGVKR